MDIKIHRGLEQIGGCITEISTNTSRIFIDFGQNLPGVGEPTTYYQDKVLVDSILSQNVKQHQAVVYTHAHPDHVGLFHHIPDELPQYIGECGHKLLLTLYKQLLKINQKLPFVEKFKLMRLGLGLDNKQLESLRRSQKIAKYHKAAIKKLRHFNTWKRTKPHASPQSFMVGDIRITPFYNCHSIYDSYMLLIEADGKRIWHMGDFREHGYLGKGLIPTLEHYATDIDVLITEGTMLSRDEECIHEREISRQMALAMSGYKYVFVLASSTDIERLASIKEAACKANKKLYINSRFMSKTMSMFSKRESANSNGLFRFHPTLIHYDDSKASKMLSEGFVMITGVSYLTICKDLYNQLNPNEVLLIYSTWDGYYKDPEQVKANPRYKGFHDTFDNVVDIHTSGHADRETLARVITTINPKESIIGIHKEPGTSLKSLDISDELKEKVKE